MKSSRPRILRFLRGKASVLRRVYHIDCNIRDRILAGRSLRSYTMDLLQQDARNYISPKQFLQRNLFFFTEPPHRDTSSIVTDDIPEQDLLEHIDSVMATDVMSWTAECLEARLRTVIKQAHGSIMDTGDPKKMKDSQQTWNRALYHNMRKALMRGSEGPSLAHTMAILGREVCRSRYQAYYSSK